MPNDETSLLEMHAGFFSGGIFISDKFMDTVRKRKKNSINVHY